MRVLFLCHRQHDVSIGGVAEFLHYLPLALFGLKINSYIYTQSEFPHQKVLTATVLKNNTPCYTGPFAKPGILVNKNSLKPLIKLCQSEKIDLIHAQGLYRSGFIAQKLKKYLNIPFIVTSHSDIVKTNSDRIRRPSVKKRCRHILKFSDAVTHLTPLMATVSHEILETKNKSVIIPNGIDLKSWQSVSTLPEQNYLFAIGRLEREKGFHILLKAFAELRKENINTSLVIAGTGSYEQALHAETKALGLNLVTSLNDTNSVPENSVIFTGYVRGERKMQLMAQSKMVLFATQPQEWEEPFGIVQLEAMASGKPLISSNIAATRYLQEYGLQAVLVKADDVMEWKNAINNLLSNPTLRKNLGAQNNKNAIHFDWGFVAKQYAEVYARALKMT